MRKKRMGENSFLCHDRRPLGDKMRYQLTKGPSIEAVYHLNVEGISNIELKLTENKGLCWSISQDKPVAYDLSVLHDWMDTYAQGKQPQVLLPLVKTQFPSFSAKILLHILPRIPFGNSMSYQELAKLAGNYRGYRAAGNACGRNPWPLIVPCHRVLAANQRLGGFSIGVEIKKRLLEFEKITFS